MNDRQIRQLGAAVAHESVATEPSEKHCALLLIAVCLLALVVRLAFISGYQGHDDRSYLTYAYILATRGEISFDHDTHWFVRAATWLPTALAIKIGGLNQYTIAAYSLACSLAGFVVAWTLGKRLFNTKTALLALLLLAFMPMDVLFATHAYVDLPVGFFMVLSFALFLYAEEREKRTAILYLLSGIAAGVAYLHRIDTAIMVGVLVWYLLARRRVRREYLALVVGGILVVAAECAFWGFAANDPLHRLRVLRGTEEGIETRLAGRASDFEEKTHGGSLLDRIDQIIPPPERIRRGENGFIEPVLMFTTNQEFGLYFFFVWPVVAFASFKKGPAKYLAIWIAGFALLHCYFPFLFPRPLWREPRYFCALTIPAMLILANWLSGVRPVLRWSVVALLISTSFGCLLLDTSRSAMATTYQLADFLKRHPAEDVWISPTFRANLFFATDVGCDRRAKAHLLAASRRANSFRCLMMLCPELEVAEEVDDVGPGYVVAGVKNHDRLLEAFSAQTEKDCSMIMALETDRGPIVKGLANGLARCGVPKKYCDRLITDEDERIEVWKVVARNAAKSQKPRVLSRTMELDSNK